MDFCAGDISQVSKSLASDIFALRIGWFQHGQECIKLVSFQLRFSTCRWKGTLTKLVEGNLYDLGLKIVLRRVQLTGRNLLWDVVTTQVVLVIL